MGKRIDHVPQETLDAFTSYSWPGNVRELQNLIERAVIRAENGVLPNPLPTSEETPVALTALPTSDKNSENLNAVRCTFSESTRALIQSALQATGWVVGGPGGAAARLGLKRTTLIAKMKKLGISRPVIQSDLEEVA